MLYKESCHAVEYVYLAKVDFWLACDYNTLKQAVGRVSRLDSERRKVYVHL